MGPVKPSVRRVGAIPASLATCVLPVIARQASVLATVALLTGCAGAGYFAGATIEHSAVAAAFDGATRTPRGKLSFDSVRLVKARVTTRPSQVVTIRGLINWSPPGKNAQFFSFDSMSQFTVQMFDSAGRAVVTNTESIKVWDGAELIGAIPPNKTVRFEMKATIPTNVWRLVRSAKVEADHHEMLKTVK